MELHDAEEATRMRKILAHDMRMKTFSGFVQTFMELFGSKVNGFQPLAISKRKSHLRFLAVFRIEL